mgnify:CR=1 FL=1
MSGRRSSSGTRPNAGSIRFFGVGRILGRLKQYRVPLALMLLTSAVGSVVDIGVPLFQRYALNRFVALDTLKGLPLYLLLYAAAILFSAVMNYISCIYGMKIEVGVDKVLRNDAFAHLQSQSFPGAIGLTTTKIMDFLSALALRFPGFGLTTTKIMVYHGYSPCYGSLALRLWPDHNEYNGFSPFTGPLLPRFWP